MKVTMVGKKKKDVEFLQACARSFANTLRFIYLHDMGKHYNVCYTIDVLQQNRINEIERYNLYPLITNKQSFLATKIRRWLTLFIR